MSNLTDFIGSSGSGTVKSIQRGVELVTGTSGSVTISTVDPDKCTVRLNQATSHYDNGSATQISSCYFGSLTATNLSFTSQLYYSGANQTNRCTWEVVEYY